MHEVKPLILPDLDVCPTFHRFRYEKMMCAGSINTPPFLEYSFSQWKRVKLTS